jgi:kexin
MFKKSLVILLFFILWMQNCKNTDKSNIQELVVAMIMLDKVINPLKFCSDRSPNPKDTFYSDQWHLYNDGSISGSLAGEDAKVQSVWQSNNKGDGVVIAVVDDGLETTHEDLNANISTSISGYNYINNTTNPNHIYDNSGHGTNVAGVAAARDLNGVGVRGAAPCATIVGRNILEQNSIPTSTESDSMIKDIEKISLSNNSWGADDNTGLLWPSSSTWQASIDTGIATGRNGKGALYFWAAGNGSEPAFGTTLSSSVGEVDNSNHDGQANYHGVLAVCGVGINGKKAAYSEQGANLWVCAHTQGNDTSSYTKAITTTDPTGNRGFNSSLSKICSDCSTNYSNRNYNNSFNGTSSATPLALGVTALLIKAYPDFSWRDIREVLAKSARKNDSIDSDWTTNAVGYNINHKYGFGTVDAANAIATAKTWTKISADYLKEDSSSTASVVIPDGNSTGVTQSISFTSVKGIKKIEYVDINFTTNHNRLGDITVTLTSPSGTKSILTKQHYCVSGNSYGVNLCDNYSSGKTFRFGSARHLGENPNGTWTLQVVDNVPLVNGIAGTGNFNFNLTIRGRTN